MPQLLRYPTYLPRVVSPLMSPSTFLPVVSSSQLGILNRRFPILNSQSPKLSSNSQPPLAICARRIGSFTNSVVVTPYSSSKIAGIQPPRTPRPPTGRNIFPCRTTQTFNCPRRNPASGRNPTEMTHGSIHIYMYQVNLETVISPEITLNPAPGQETSPRKITVDT